MARACAVFLVILSASFSAAAKPAVRGATETRIISTARISSVLELAKQLGAREILVDFDDTLQTAVQPAAGVRHYDRLYKQMLRAEHGNAKRAEARAMRIWNALQKVSAQRPVEPSTRPIIETLKKSYKVIGLTAQQHQLIGPVLTKLQRMGLAMSDEAAAPRRLGADVWYAGGAIFCGLSDKPSALALCQQKRPLVGPVLVVDDKRKNVEQVVSYLQSCGLRALGVHYTAVAKSVPYEPRLADAQLAIFRRTGELRPVSGRRALHVTRR